MSETNSFIEEVTEEVRRDRLFALYRRYGWIGIVLIILIVAGAGFYEYRNAQRDANAQAIGDALSSALEIEDAAQRAAALAQLSESAPILTQLHEANALLDAGDRAGALVVLDRIATDPNTDQVHADLAQLKALLIRGSDLPAADRITAYEALSTPGRAFRLIALEQGALAMIENEQREQGLDALLALLDEPQVSDAMRTRVQQIFITLGGRFPDAQ